MCDRPRCSYPKDGSKARQDQHSNIGVCDGRSSDAGELEEPLPLGAHRSPAQTDQTQHRQTTTNTLSCSRSPLPSQAQAGKSRLLSLFGPSTEASKNAFWFFSATEFESLRLRLICLALESGRRKFRTHGPAWTACRVLPSETERSGAALADICFQLCVTPGRTESISAAEGHPLRDERASESHRPDERGSQTPHKK